MPIFTHSDNSSLYPHQSTASGDRDGKHRLSLCCSFSDGEREPETGTSFMPCFFCAAIWSSKSFITFSKETSHLYTSNTRKKITSITLPVSLQFLIYFEKCNICHFFKKKKNPTLKAHNCDPRLWSSLLRL